MTLIPDVNRIPVQFPVHPVLFAQSDVPVVHRLIADQLALYTGVVALVPHCLPAIDLAVLNALGDPVPLDRQTLVDLIDPGMARHVLRHRGARDGQAQKRTQGE